MFSDPMEVAQGTADEPTRGESVGTYIALTILFLIHMICWIVSIVKALKDRKAIKSRLKDCNAKQKLLPADSEPLESEKDNSEAPGVKFALTHADENGSATPAAAAVATNGRRPSKAEPVKHHFARSQQRVLSAGKARRVTAEELAIMLDSYSVPPVTDDTRPPPSPRPIPSPTVQIEVEHAGPQALLA